VQSFDVESAATRLGEAGGGYEVVHESPGLELGVYVLVAPVPDRQTPHAYDEVYVVLEGSADIEVDGETRSIAEGDALFVAAHAEHRFSRYQAVSLLVIFNGPHSSSRGPER
jgi:mannose-6-phosphate isomerase-like protein (cupin superfamily)